MNNLYEVLHGVIKGGYPEFLNETMCIEYKRMKNDWFRNFVKHKKYNIWVNEDLKNISRDPMEGGLAHELSHLARNDKNTKRIFEERKLCRKYEEYFRLVERDTELDIIIRGFGSKLLALMKLDYGKDFRYERTFGLSVPEVEILLGIGGNGHK